MDVIKVGKGGRGGRHGSDIRVHGGNEELFRRHEKEEEPWGNDRLGSRSQGFMDYD